MKTPETLTVKTPSGLEVVFEARRSNLGRWHVEGRIPARKVDGVVYRRPEPIAPRDGAVFAVSIGAATVGFDAAAGAAIAEWMDRAEAWIAATPEATADRLRAERQNLCDRIAGGHDDFQSANSRAWERGDAERAFGTFDSSALRAQIAAFDAAHPEIVAQLAADHAAATKRALAAA